MSTFEIVLGFVLTLTIGLFFGAFLMLVTTTHPRGNYVPRTADTPSAGPPPKPRKR